MKLLYGFFGLLLFSTSVHAFRDDVLVIVNENSIDSDTVGSYYAGQREIDPSNIVRVKVPASYYMTWDEFRSLRDQVIEHMQLNTLEASQTNPAPCVIQPDAPYSDTKYYCEASTSQLKDYSKIRYIVMTKGVPTTIRYVTGSQTASGKGPASVDNYIRFWLVNYYTEDAVFTSIPRSAAFGDGRYMRPVEPSRDSELIVGRIDGITLDAAIALADRAVAAEQNGVFGRLFGAGPHISGTGSLTTTLGPMRWLNYSSVSVLSTFLDSASLVYPGPGSLDDAWRYQFGLWGETDPVCTDYTQNYLAFDVSSGSESDNAPQTCKVVISEMRSHGEEIPGYYKSRAPLYDGQPLAVDALVYMGNQDGQSTGANVGARTAQLSAFDTATNWRRSGDLTCSAYCEDQACRDQSDDPMQEINTACVGVAEGFIGYNLQSFPVAGNFAWPTGWHGHAAGATVRFSGLADYVWFPEVRTDVGASAGNTKSLWFRNTEQIGNPLCYAGAAAEGELAPCIDTRIINAFQTIAIESPISAGKRYLIRLNARGEGIDKNIDIKISIQGDFANFTGGYQTISGNPETLISLPAGTTSGWVSDEVVLDLTQLDPVKVYTNYLRLYFESSDADTGEKGYFTGGIGLDDLEVREIDPDTQIPGENLANNPSLTEGFRQVSGGDFPSMFLSRMNGTAFWGSMSHHVSGGSSFADGMMERLIYWFRGLPLGDAVWFGEGRRWSASKWHANSGILYGDPLYSPVAIRFKYANVQDKVAKGLVPLYGSTVNGRDSTKVSTTYRIDFCPGRDFYLCDQAGTWQDQDPELNGTGGQEDMYLGDWDTSSLTPGDYTLRLAVTSTNSGKGRTQALYDYYPITVYDTADETDIIWVDDAVPTGGSQNGLWNWTLSDPLPFSGTQVHQSEIASGLHQHYFERAQDKLIISAGDSLFAYVYLDPENPPSEVMLQWRAPQGGWGHRAYWGANLIGWGTDGTASLRYMGPLPAAGQWVRLEVPAEAVGLAGVTVDGMAFTLYDGRATWDYAGKTPLKNTIWVDDAVPTGGTQNGPWNWVLSNPLPFTGTQAHQSDIASGLHQHYFERAQDKLTINAGDSLFAYVYLDPDNLPSQIMLQWRAPQGGWEHRAYWGANNIDWGLDDTASRRYMGPLPVAGQWVRLEVPASDVGLEGITVDGMAFTLYDGRATWDFGGKFQN